MSRTVLVTGAAGLIGRAVVDLLRRNDVRVTALDRTGDVAGADRVVVGDAIDPVAVRAALSGADGVVHLAAIPAPVLGTAVDVYAGNSRATFVVLDAAAEAGVRRAVIASSYSILGLAWGPDTLRPAYVPVDEASPLQVADPYALSKQADEATAAMMHRRYGMTVTALRFPYVGDVADRLPKRAAELAADPAVGRAELWSYLDVRDAAAACWAGLTAAPPGSHPLFVAAPDTLAPYPTRALLDAYLPDVPRRAEFPGRTVPIDVSAARRVLGWRARHPWPLESRDLEAP